MTAPFWSLQDFSLAHRRDEGEELLLSATTIDVPRGGFYLLVGKSGGGKSSLVRLCVGLFDPREPLPRTKGRFECLGESVTQGPSRSLRARMAAILQEEGLLDELTPRENIELALRAAGRSLRLAPALLAQVGLDPAPERIASMSGGMRKRLAVARALAAEPEALFCDEPTAGLDPQSATQIAALLRRAHEASRGRTTVVVTHDIAAFEGLHDGILELDRGRRTLRLRARGEAAEEPLGSEASVDDEKESDLVHAMRHATLAFGAVAHTIASSILRLPPFEMRQSMRSLIDCSLSPLPFVAGASAAIGGIATFFALRNNPVEGGFEAEILQGAGKVLLAVLVPLLCAFFFVARVAAGATARLGTMTRNQQVAALRMMGVDPADYLLTPLVWGMVIGLPVATFVGAVFASAAGLLAAQAVSGTSTLGFVQAWFRDVDPVDLKTALAKSALSGYLVALVCYHLGSGPKRSGADVGDAVNRAIVLAMGIALFVHAALTLWVYV